MCGIAGFLGYADLRPDAVADFASRMGDAIRHRGPDDAGIWCDKEGQVALVHRRLSILDLSPAGHQPMVSASGRYVIVFNGEIYNHLELRSTLEKVGIGDSAGVVWRGHSDTETLLAGIEIWGLDKALQRTVGMFAIALWDRQDRTLCLVRDRMGEKPLYCGWQRGVFLFGSELKALKVHPAFVGEIDRDAITLQLRYNYIPAPYSIYQGIGKLPAGTVLRISSRSLSGASLQGVESAKPYWSLTDEVACSRSVPFVGSDKEAVAALDDLLGNAVAQQTVADVPLGAFLSGGIDSSTIVALMQSQSRKPVKTFTIGFNEAGYNEAQHAKRVARHLGTDHTELYVTPEQALSLIPRLPNLFDEPFSDDSQIPTFLLSEMTKQHVAVSLSGDAGDELFGGYSRYATTSNLWGINNSLPRYFRKSAIASIRMLPISTWDLLAAPIKPFLPVRMRNVGDKLHKLAELLAPTERMDFYRQCVSHWLMPENVVLGGVEPDISFAQNFEKWMDMAYVESMMLADSLSYLPDDILVKVDRAAMGTSLETRVPFLDHRIVKFAWRLPLSMKVRHGQGKWILRQVLYKYVPKELIERPKMGFGVPIDFWLRGPLRHWAENLLDESRLRQEGYFNPAPIRQKWIEHLSGTRNWKYQLWNVLMFQSWLEVQKR